MSKEIVIAGPIAFMEDSGSAVYFSAATKSAGEFPSMGAGTRATSEKLQNDLNVALWGEDNRFPQNIETVMKYCGIGKAGLDWKARALYGGGIVPGIVIGMDPVTKEEVFEPLNRVTYKDVYNFIEHRSFTRFLVEYLQDWVWYGNCFPELVFDMNGKKITNIVHQESCDCRYQQMDDKGKIKSVYISKLWGAADDAWVKFDPEKKMLGITANPKTVTKANMKFIKTIPCIDMYDDLNSLNQIAETFKPGKILKSAILPVNYPSTNKTYYQLVPWDGARLAGWVEIACKVPSILKSLYNKAFNIKYHIEIPDSYFPEKYGTEEWEKMLEPARTEAKKQLLQEMNEFLMGDKNAYKTFVSFFGITPHEKKEYGQIKISVIDQKNTTDKDLVTSSAADLQILISMQVNPTIFGAGTVGTGSQRSGGSDIRESFLVYNAQLALERQLLLAPLYLISEYNAWGEGIKFKFRDTVLTTLDTGAGTKKTVS